eukprot:210150_1
MTPDTDKHIEQLDDKAVIPLGVVASKSESDKAGKSVSTGKVQKKKLVVKTDGIKVDKDGNPPVSPIMMRLQKSEKRDSHRFSKRKKSQSPKKSAVDMTPVAKLSNKMTPGDQLSGKMTPIAKPSEIATPVDQPHKHIAPVVKPSRSSDDQNKPTADLVASESESPKQITQISTAKVDERKLAVKTDGQKMAKDRKSGVSPRMMALQRSEGRMSHRFSRKKRSKRTEMTPAGNKKTCIEQMTPPAGVSMKQGDGDKAKIQSVESRIVKTPENKLEKQSSVETIQLDKSQKPCEGITSERVMESSTGKPKTDIVETTPTHVATPVDSVIRTSEDVVTPPTNLKPASHPMLAVAEPSGDVHVLEASKIMTQRVIDLAKAEAILKFGDIVCVQSLCRGFLGINECREIKEQHEQLLRVSAKVKQRKRSAVLIQSQFRGVRERKDVEAVKLFVEHEHEEQVKESEDIERRKSSAILVQSQVGDVEDRESVVAVKHIEEPFEKQHIEVEKTKERRVSAVLIQSYFRGVKERKDVEAVKQILDHDEVQHGEKEKAKRRKSAVLIQSQFRGVKERKDVEAVKHIVDHDEVQHGEKEKAKRRKSAVLIQSQFRGVKERKDVEAVKHIVDYDEVQHGEKEKAKRRKSAVLIQSQFRGVKERKDVEAVKHIVELEENQKETEATQRRKISAVLIQSQFRGIRERKDVEAAKQVVEYAHTSQTGPSVSHAATTLQSLYRGNRSRHECARLLGEKTSSVQLK